MTEKKLRALERGNDDKNRLAKVGLAVVVISLFGVEIAGATIDAGASVIMGEPVGVIEDVSL